jgi:hypothetical protein
MAHLTGYYKRYFLKPGKPGNISGIWRTCQVNFWQFTMV